MVIIMENVKILDCTLRDGGRIINCSFKNHDITEITQYLTDAGVDIVELGFIRSGINYCGNSTFFSDVDQIIQLIDCENTKDTKYVVFIDHGMYHMADLPTRKVGNIHGIRFGFTKTSFFDDKETLRSEIELIKQRGYELYLQDVNTIGYSDKELLELIEFVNEIKPISFGIVDTYGSMYQEDLERIFSIVNFNLNRDIGIDFHSHNNMQLSFALAQRMISLCKNRLLIIDATLNGMGKCAGNLNTELIVDYLNRKCGCDYDLDILLDIIDEYLYDIKKNKFWGYSIPSFMAGIYKAHPNNIIYLTEKFRLGTKDIRHIVSRIEEKKRQTYDYDNIKKIYTEYNANKVDDKAAIELINQEVDHREIVLLVPGHSLVNYEEQIKQYIQENNVFTISVNFVNTFVEEGYSFFANQRRYKKTKETRSLHTIITSNIISDNNTDIFVNYHSYIEDAGNYFDNSTIMLLNLLKKTEVKKISIAGFDGFDENLDTNFYDQSFYESRLHSDFITMNEAIEEMLRGYSQKISGKIKISFLTPSRFEHLFQRKSSFV